MTTETPAPQIPQAVHAAMAEWGRHHAYVTRIDAESERLDAQITGMQQQLAELTQRHADLGRQRHDAEREEGIARSMAARGCELAGIEMPAEPPTIPAPPALPANVVPGEALVNGAAYPATSQGADALHALGQGVAGHAVTETVTDPPDGGGTATPDFQPDPQGDGGDRGDTGTRGRRAGRRGR